MVYLHSTFLLSFPFVSLFPSYTPSNTTMPRLPNAFIYLQAFLVPTRLKPDLRVPSEYPEGEGEMRSG